MGKTLVLFVSLFLFAPCVLRGADFSAVNDFTYQLQNYNLTALQNCGFDLVVMDYSKEGDAATEFSASEISSIKTGGPCGGKIVVSYISIGEAEDYRFYWEPSWVDANGNPIKGVAPAWLGKMNPDWPGNYKVRYWDPEWQSIIFDWMDEIIAAGFDGVYLDIIDAFEYWGPSENGGNNKRRDSAVLMVDFVRAIANYARVTKGMTNFLVIPQNGAGIIADWSYPDDIYPDPAAEADNQKTRYFEVINAIGAEDTFFRGPNNNNNPWNPDYEVIELLDEFLAGGKKVLCVDYVTKANKINRLYNTARNTYGYIPYATKRNLNVLTVNSAFPPDCPP